MVLRLLPEVALSSGCIVPGSVEVDAQYSYVAVRLRVRDPSQGELRLSVSFMPGLQPDVSFVTLDAGAGRSRVWHQPQAKAVPPDWALPVLVLAFNAYAEMARTSFQMRRAVRQLLRRRRHA